MVKFILVTGGVLSGLGKGIITSSTGLILKELGFFLIPFKIDPYLNIDCGTMNPYEHGEVFVCKDGSEVDLDLGNYERFMGCELAYGNNITTGKIYQRVIEKERRGEYLGQTVQVIPHITNEIINWIETLCIKMENKEKKKDPKFTKDKSICIIELGGTIGDIESMPFIEALRQLRLKVGSSNFLNIHVSLVPCISVVGEQKTKPTQASVRTIRSLGIDPDIIVCRSEKPITNNVRQKISSFCFHQKNTNNVISCHNVSNVFDVPLLIHAQKIDEIIINKLKLPYTQISKEPLREWRDMVIEMMNITKKKEKLRIALVGKYTQMEDCYFSVVKALKHACYACNIDVNIIWLESSSFISKNQTEKKEAWKSLNSCKGILMPGGFGGRGVEGMIACCEYARKNGIPWFGICLGFQIGVIEFARNVLNLKEANSTEFDEKTKDPLIIFMPEVDKLKKGGTMRLGEKKVLICQKKSKFFQMYSKKDIIFERHRHRYEVNKEKYMKIIEKKGMKFVAMDEKGIRLEAFEVEDHPHYIACQYHCEFKSYPLKPHPLFVGFVQASKKRLNK